MSDFDWNLIRSFVAVGETGSLSAAARRLASSQPTIGRHIDELERALGIKLFVRGRRGYDLTAEGAGLLARGQAATQAMTAVSLDAAGRDTRLAGTVRVAASQVIAAMVLPAIAAELGREEPDIELEIVASDRVENLLRRDADIAIRMVRPAQSELIAKKLGDIALALCAARAYLDRRGRPQTLSELLTHDLIGFDRSDLILQGMAGIGISVERRAFRFRTDDQVVYWQALRAGNGIGFAQTPLIEADPDVERLLPEIVAPPLPVWLATHRDLRAAPRIRRVLDFLEAGLRRHIALGS